MLAESFYLYGAVSFEWPGTTLQQLQNFIVWASSPVPQVAYKLMKLCHVRRDLCYFDVTIEVPRVKQGQSLIVELFHGWQRKVIG